MHSFVGTAKRNGPGLAGSVLLHFLAALMLLGLIVRHGSTTTTPFVAVELIRLQDETQSPTGAKGPAKIAAALQKQTPASPSDAAVSPTGKQPPHDALDAKLKALARQAMPTQHLTIETDTGTDDETAGGGVGGLSYSLRDYIRAQILRRWTLDLGKLGTRRIVVRLNLTMKRNGTITAVDFASALPQNDSLYRDIAIGAKNAALLSSPIALPPGEYPSEMHVAIALDTRWVRR